MNLDLELDISYFKQKRDFALEKFNDLVLSGGDDERIERWFNILVRAQKHLKLIEDAMIIHCIINKPREK